MVALYCTAPRLLQETSPIVRAFSELNGSHTAAPRKGSLFSNLWKDVYKPSRALYHLSPIGYAVPLCSGPREAPSLRTINVTEVTTSQEELNLVMNSVMQNSGVVRDMVEHEFAVRALRTCVAASNLYRRREIANELDSPISETKKTAKGLSCFTAKVGKSIDTVVTSDAYASRTLEGIAICQQQVPTVPQKMMYLLHSLSAFEFTDAA